MVYRAFESCEPGPGNGEPGTVPLCREDRDDPVECRCSRFPVPAFHASCLMPNIGLGCMRLSTAADRNDARSIAVIHTALDAGATLLDTSNAYCHDDTETGHNERLIAEALRTWGGDPSRVEV